MDEIFHILYTISDITDLKKRPLYIQEEGDVLDFFTYFNSFSLSKWRRYTSLQKVKLQLVTKGKWRIIYQIGDVNGIHTILEKNFEGNYSQIFDIVSFKADILGFQLKPLSPDASYISGAWYGLFTNWQEKSIGLSITTFKREHYVKKNIDFLKTYQKNSPWLHVLVVDNGRTLPKENNNCFRLIHNPNYGGSGGFARGMIEYANKNNVDYVLLMDDDIVMDGTVLERTHSLACAIKEKYKDSFFSGAMLNLENPTIQYENTAYWGKIRLHGFRKNLDLSIKNNLIINEQIVPHKNQYGAWWYCCIPLQRIKKIGYPLPIFIKGDDIEYGVRNKKDLIHINGIGVWHQSFSSKLSPIVNYYSDRNMLIINNYMEDCGFLTFFTAIWGRFFKRLFLGDHKELQCLNQAIIDYNSNINNITSIPADQKMQEVTQLITRPFKWIVIFEIVKNIIISVLNYRQSHDDYLKFRQEKLYDNRFWKYFLKIEDNYE